MEAPDGSTTNPERAPVVPICAAVMIANSANKVVTAKIRRKRLRLMVPPLMTVRVEREEPGLVRRMPHTEARADCPTSARRHTRPHGTQECTGGQIKVKGYFIK